MKTTQKGIDLIKKYEGVRLNAYKPVPTEKYFTIGYGHYGKDVSPNMVITMAQAEEFLKKDLEKFEAKVNKYSKYDWTQDEFDALVSFTYNIGNIDQLTQNGTRSKSEIAKMIPAYNKAGGKVLQGLVKRRAEEQKLYLSGTSETISPTSSFAKKYPSTVRLGSRGSDVALLQQKLNENGYHLRVDGIFGSNTFNALVGYQAEKGLIKDAICGPKTWKELLG